MTRKRVNSHYQVLRSELRSGLQPIKLVIAASKSRQSLDRFLSKQSLDKTFNFS